MKTKNSILHKLETRLYNLRQNPDAETFGNLYSAIPAFAKKRFQFADVEFANNVFKQFHPETAKTVIITTAENIVNCISKIDDSEFLNEPDMIELTRKVNLMGREANLPTHAGILLNGSKLAEILKSGNCDSDELGLVLTFVANMIKDFVKENEG